jgi:hypothetical protein
MLVIQIPRPFYCDGNLLYMLYVLGMVFVGAKATITVLTTIYSTNTACRETLHMTVEPP